MKKISLCVSIAGMFMLTAHAQTITWQTPTVISGASDVLNNGTYFGSWAPFDGGANALPVNGVTFHGNSDLPSLSASGFSGDGGPYYDEPSTGNANYNNLLQYGQYAGGANASFSWGGMTAGDTYEIQFWVEDIRGSTAARWENLSGGDIGSTAYGTDTSAAVGYSSPVFSSTTSPGYDIVGTFVADNTDSEQILLTAWDANNNPSAQINLFQVRDITAAPEPSTLAILACSAGLMLLRFRRRA